MRPVANVVLVRGKGKDDGFCAERREHLGDKIRPLQSNA
jgi:hypothetical protein